MPEKAAETLETLLGALTDKQRLFVLHYAKVGCNATKAALAAGYSKASADVIGSENLGKPEIRRAINALLESAGVTPEAVKSLLQRHQAATIDDFEEWLDGSKTLKQLRKEGVDVALVKGAEVREIPLKAGGMMKIRKLTLHDAQSAAVQLGRVLGIVQDRHKVEIGGSVDLVAGLRDLSDEELKRFAEATNGDEKPAEPPK